MAQTVFIQLTTAGTDAGPFDLYSNVDGYTIPFENNVAKASLQAGYTSVLVPDSATTIRVQSDNVICDNFIDLSIITTTTTTSSTSSTTTTTTSSTTSTTTSTTTVSPCDPGPFNYYLADAFLTGSCIADGTGILVALDTSHIAVIGEYYCPCVDDGRQYQLTSSSTAGFAVILTSTHTNECLAGNCFS